MLELASDHHTPSLNSKSTTNPIVIKLMFELEKQFRFEAAHVLKHHQGKCGRPHGHSYCLTVCLRSQTLTTDGSSTNMVVDFADITSVVDPLVETFLDHQWLNDTLQCESPTTEFIARWIFHYLKPKLPFLHSVTLSETPTSTVTYTE